MKKELNSKQSTAGFTLVEMLVTVAIIGILAAIATPSWLTFVQIQRLNAAQDQALMAVREAQSKAKNQKQCWEASFRDNGTTVQWSTHLPSVATTNCPTTAPVSSWIWNDLIGENASKIAIDTSSTLRQQSGAYRVQFQFNGWLNGVSQQGRITFITRSGSSNPKRCVWVSTLLGALRTAQDNDC